MDGSDIIDLAGHLVVSRSLGNAEARYRTAISRAYYGAFHLARAFLEGQSIPVVEGPSGHVDAYRKLYHFGDAQIRQAAWHLNDLFTERINADYRLDREGFDSRANAEEKVALAHRIRSHLKAYRPDQSKPSA